MSEEKSYWYYFNYRCTSNRGNEFGGFTSKFAARIEGPNFGISMEMLGENIKNYLKENGAKHISNIMTSDIFYIGHFEKMEESK